MARGTVKWFNDHKGYGFITAEGQMQDLYVHFSAIEGTGFRTLHEGDHVEFEVKPSTRSGHEAVHVTKI